MTAHSITTTRNRFWRLAAAGAALALLGSGAQAESAWSRLAKAISPNGETAQARQTIAPALARNQEVVALVDENVQPVDMRPGETVALLSPGSAAVEPGSLAAARANYRHSDKQLDLGMESDDTGALTATNLFHNPEILRLMGDQPRFKYDPAGKSDPMLVPWVRSAAIFNELNTSGKALLAAGQLDEATAIFQRILELNDERYRVEAMAAINQIVGMKNEKAMAVLTAEQQQTEAVVLELPAWVQDNTTATIVDASQQLCMVGEHMLTVGQSVPDYPDVQVAAIENERVIYQIKSQTFEVQLTNR